MSELKFINLFQHFFDVVPRKNTKRGIQRFWKRIIHQNFTLKKIQASVREGPRSLHSAVATHLEVGPIKSSALQPGLKNMH